VALALAMLSLALPMSATAEPAGGAPVAGLSSPTHPDSGTWYSNDTPRFIWDALPVSGFSYVFDHNATSEVDTSVDTVDAGFTAVRGSNPTGEYYSVAVGDFNHDGFKDVVGAAYDPSPGFQVNLSDGVGGYAAPVTYPVSTRAGTAGPGRVLVADFNNDGWDDVAVTSSGWSSSASIYLNNHDGTFGSENVVYTGGYYGLAGAVGDLNGDGNADIVIANHYATPDGQDNQNDGDVRVLLGNGDGTFQGPATYLTAKYPLDVALADMNGDGKLDIVTANDLSTSAFCVLLNDGDGTFPTPADRSLVPTFAATQWPTGLAIADFNGDGHMDVACGTPANNFVFILRGNGDGTLEAYGTTYLNGATGRALAAGDLNGDGAPDLTLGYGVVALNNGDGSFAPSISGLPNYSAGNGQGFAIADMNADGSAEVVTADNSPYGFAIAKQAPGVAFPGTPDGTWFFHVRAVASDGSAGDISTRAVKIDTKAPSVELSGATDGAAYLAGEAPDAVITATDPNMPDASGVKSVFYQLDGQDRVDLDGDTATITLPSTPGVYGCWYGASDGAGNWCEWYHFTVTILGDVTGLASPTHPDPDTWYSNNTPGLTWDVLSGLGYSYAIDHDPGTVPDTEADTVAAAGLLAEPTTFQTGSYPTGIATGDFDEDGVADLAVANTDDNTVSIHHGAGDGTFWYGEVPVYDVGSGPDSIAVADLDGDGHLDLAIANEYDSTVSILYGDGGGGFEDGGSYDCVSYPYGIAAGDLNGDGVPEIAVASWDDATGFSVLTRGEDGSYGYQFCSLGESWNEGGIAIADTDGDGVNEIVTNYEGGVVVADNVDGTFPVESMQFMNLDTYPASVAVGDLNGDGAPDIYAPDSNDYYATVLWNDSDGYFDAENATWLDAISCCTYGAQIADVDGDGNPDLIGVNEDEYTVSVWLGDGEGGFGDRQDFDANSLGYGVVAADFNGDGRADIATGNNDSGVSVLLAGASAQASFGPLEDGAWYFHVRQVSGEGEGAVGGPTATMKVNIDTAPPTVEPSGVTDGGVYVAGASPEAVLTATDPNMPEASGVAQLRYYDPVLDDVVSVDGDTASFELPTEPGSYEYEYWAIDAAGNEGDHGYLTVTIVGELSGLVSPTHPDPATWYSNDTPGFAWDYSSVAGYSYLLDQSAGTLPDENPDPTQATELLGAGASYPVGAGAKYLASGDFNGDGRSDLVASDCDTTSVTIQLNDGSGAFQGAGDPPATYDVGMSPRGVAVADFNEDDNLDIAVAVTDGDSSNVVVLYGNGDGTFDLGGTYDCIANPGAIALGDFSGDGLPDLAVATENDGSAFGILTNTGDGFSYARRGFEFANATGAIAVADLNLDGHIDVVMACDGGLLFAYSDGDGGFTFVTRVDGVISRGLTAADLDGDHRPDVIQSTGNGYTAILYNIDDTAFTAYAWSIINSGANGFSAAVGDVNADAVPDLFTACGALQTVSVYPGTGFGMLNGAYTVSGTGATGQGVVCADFNGDGRDDVAAIGDSWIDGSPVRGISVMLAGAPWNVACGPVEDGTYYFHVRTIGSDGYAGETASMQVNIDAHAPEMGVKGVENGGSYCTPQRAGIIADDQFSGVEWVQWRLPGGDWTQVEGDVAMIDIPADVLGEFSYGYRSCDHAGNVSEPATFTVNIVAPPATHTLAYTAGAGGSIEGSSTQVVVDGSDGTTITAVAADGYRFVSWSDDATSAERRDTAVTASLTVEASFVLAAAAHDDTVTAYSRPTWVTPLANDDAGVGAIASLTQPSHGAVTRPDGAPAGSALYTPADGYLGADSFTYATESGATATVTVTVVPNISAPTGVGVARVTTHSVEVSWTAPTSFGSGFAAYQVMWRSHGTEVWNLCDPIAQSSTTTCTVLDLAPGVTYDFEVTVRDTGEYVATSTPASFLLVGDAPAPVAPPVTSSGEGTVTVPIAGVGEGASLTVDPEVADGTPGLRRVILDGLNVLIIPEPGFTGQIDLPVEVTKDGATATVHVVVTFAPGDPYSVTFGPASSTSTVVRWAGSLGATGYRIYVSGSLVGTTGPAVSSFTVKRLLGPNMGVTVQAVGNDGTESAQVRATYKLVAAVKIGTVSFRPNSSTLTASAKRTLNKLASLVAAQGFRTLNINGITGRSTTGSAAFRKRLAAARAAAVKSYLAHRFKYHLHVSVKITTSTASGTAISSTYRVAQIVLR